MKLLFGNSITSLFGDGIFAFPVISAGKSMGRTHLYRLARSSNASATVGQCSLYYQPPRPTVVNDSRNFFVKLA